MQPEDPSWYVFNKCKVLGSSGASVKAGSVFLGRPWRKLARVMFQNSKLSEIIHKDGWTKMAEGATPFYYEFNNSGPGAAIEARKYAKPASKAIDIATVLRADHSWIDSKY